MYQHRQPRRIADRAGHRRAVEIRAEPDVVDSGAFHEVVDHCHQDLDRRIRIVITVWAIGADLEVHADHPV